MAQFCVEIPDDKVEIVITSLASIYRYQPVIGNPNYNPSLNNIPEFIVNNDRQPEFISNPDFNIELPEGEDNLTVISNPSYDPDEPEMILNPEYDAVSIAANTQTIANPETVFMFANRMVRNWITENVMAYQSQQAAEQARQQALNSFNLEIRDPQV